MDKNKARILLALTLAVVALAGRVESAEPAFKQEPPDHLRSYFVKTPLPNYPKAASTWHKQGNGLVPAEHWPTVEEQQQYWINKDPEGRD